ncbi:hypothetical protein ACI6Q2_07720 [Chitinophagaceae bacterium LWZ2-11]
MNIVKNIFFSGVVLILPFAALHAQAKKKKTTAKHTTTQPAKGKQTASKKAQPAAAKKTVVRQEAESQVKVTSFSKDTSSPREVTITSAFKPSLRNAAKINFIAASQMTDTSRVPLSYNIPSQNLFFSYKPVAIKPLALFVDSSFKWENHQYVKVGFGNYTTPYAELGLGFGDGTKSIINIHGRFTSSKGNLPFQQFNKTGIEALGIFNTGTNQEVTGKLFWDNSTQYKYGFRDTVVKYTKDDLRQQFSNVGLQLGLRNKIANDYGITYHPEVMLNYFTDNRSANEFSLKAIGQINKSFGRVVAFDLSGTADITQFSRSLQGGNSIKNNLFYINPSLQFKTPNFKLNTGIQPSWDNSKFYMLPNITAEGKITDERFIIMAGWVGYFNKNTYQSLTSFNPYIDQPTSLLNTRVREEYAGFKGSVGKHLTYNAKLAFMQMDNLALYGNDTATNNSQTMDVLYDPKVQAVRLHGEIGYTLQEKFIFNAAATYTKYTKLQQYDKAYGLLPLEVTGSFRWKIVKDVQLKSDLFFWDGAHYYDKAMTSLKLPAAVDLNLGVEFAVAPKLNVWLELNNLLNNRYQRWNQYQVLGFQVLGGVVYSFR